MRTNVIRQRVADFLARHAPFDSLSAEDLLELAGSGRVKFHESEEYVHRQGDPPGPIVWVIEQGRVELLDERDSGERLCDLAGEGDILGLERFAGQPAALYSARTGTDVILYGVATPLLEELAKRYPAVCHFFAARVSVAGASAGVLSRTSWLERDAPPLDFLRARTQPDHLQGLRNQPLPEAPAPVSTRTAVRLMLSHREPRLAVLDPTAGPHSRTALLTESDLALFSGYQPVRLAQEIRRGESAATIVPLLRQAERLVLEGLAQPRDIDECCLFGSEVMAALAAACIRLAARDVAAAGLDPPRVPHCWALFGAPARHDMTSARAPTLAAVYDDAAPGFDPLDSAYFTALAGQTAAWFDTCGVPCDAGDWPRGTQPGMPLSEWKRLYSETVRDPLRHALWERRHFFDLRFLDGDDAVFEDLRQHARAELAAGSIVVPLLANDTLKHVSRLTFFQGLVLDLDGTQHHGFDVDSAVIAPLADAARVFMLSRPELTPVNTLERLLHAEGDFPDAAPVIREAADAFRIGLYYRTLAGQHHLDAAGLAKYEQLLLKTALASVERFLAFTLATFVPSTEPPQ